MYCKACGKTIEPSTAHCPYCGRPADALSGGTGFWDLLDAPNAPKDNQTDVNPVVEIPYRTNANSNNYQQTDVPPIIDKKNTQLDNNRRYRPKLMPLYVLFVVILVAQIVQIVQLNQLRSTVPTQEIQNTGTDIDAAQSTVAAESAMESKEPDNHGVDVGSSTPSPTPPPSTSPTPTPTPSPSPSPSPSPVPSPSPSPMFVQDGTKPICVFDADDNVTISVPDEIWKDSQKNEAQISWWYKNGQEGEPQPYNLKNDPEPSHEQEIPYSQNGYDEKKYVCFSITENEETPKYSAWINLYEEREKQNNGG